jgi:hypothetical protein
LLGLLSVSWGFSCCFFAVVFAIISRGSDSCCLWSVFDPQEQEQKRWQEHTGQWLVAIKVLRSLHGPPPLFGICVLRSMRKFSHWLVARPRACRKPSPECFYACVIIVLVRSLVTARVWNCLLQRYVVPGLLFTCSRESLLGQYTNFWHFSGLAEMAYITSCCITGL